jgi:ketosteroid isomerase-like protein
MCTTSAIAALRGLDAAFDAAFSAGDTETLAALLADDFVYTHSTGVSQAKEVFVEYVAGRQSRSVRRTSDVIVQLHADVAVIYGNLTISYSTGRPDHYLRYVRVYRSTLEAWKPIAQRMGAGGRRRAAGGPQAPPLRISFRAPTRSTS